MFNICFSLKIPIYEIYSINLENIVQLNKLLLDLNIQNIGLDLLRVYILSVKSLVRILKRRWFYQSATKFFPQYQVS